ncbi:FMN-binding negative transcriptional regulator [Tuwongella immobilis]|uniref:FMN-binding negative transcriptional regulator n=1 Tax=Tuwongella immobilis TaxID=692036 RepID=A0A6C2YIQ4_9BACT|nr:FMN-binding negative transcriptional regulator [Tuwongella immobilis]VIP00965.1 transcriptional regulator : Transcriptional regulator OS=Singulisphaera acidiphila (strain ATCC BAA-1392 / DSM 18658 / VKM B-2454 / MOB10) GN=Sinac_7182 PE=4 SV=1: FMN_bind_2 [Tuwongella immobilis]VTR97348.1 transcriptional regulator : Transcriptional regulator OS=Singulisphaera acidiphila (strain ATCC BAA-1392 / DSM 18658 / VKM B-2454 / MOB10) GN=Sinac_7182 PE=4 SV=1: FMN_bind_2 [Tuwongella immobilis]
MYVPKSFQQSDPAILAELIQREPFGLLLHVADGAPFGSHVPFLFDADDGPHGTLIGHLARANPQANLSPNAPVTVIFSGPHAYISPRWYAEPETVPTWNFLAVHAQGTWQPITDRNESLAVLSRLTNHFESSADHPWTFDPTSPLAEKLVQAIVSFRIPVTSMQGKWKLSQNQPHLRWQRVVTELEQSSRDNDTDLAAWMRRFPPAE